jgi:hypothetical protein
MACAKPPSSSGMTPPAGPTQPAPLPVYSALRQMENAIETKPPGESVDKAIKWAEDCLASAIAAGVRGAELQRLQNKLDDLKHFAVLRQRDAIGQPGLAAPRSRHEKSVPLDKALEKFGEPDAKKLADRVVAPLVDTTHWQHEDYCRHLVNVIQGNDKLPDKYKEQLPRDVADVLKACPHAAGLVKELTLRGQRRATGSPSKLGSRWNSGIGSAYELMGTAALTRTVVPAGNNGPSLHLNSGVDHVTFGDKATINSSLDKDGNLIPRNRATIECDLRIGRPGNALLLEGWREIGVDFKHVAHGDQRSNKPGDRNQIENVANVIRDGTIHEYHYVTNGTFHPDFKAWVSEENADLQAHGLTPIAYHEYVTSV